jgi:glycosyltransferase involved in cell wall biosynthesis
VKIAIIVTDVNTFDGVNRVGADLITMLKMHGHDVAVCSWTHRADETFEEFMKVDNFYAASGLSKRFKGRLIKSLLLSRSSIRKCLKDVNPDVFVGVGSEPAVFSSVPNGKVKVQFVHFPTEFFMEVRSSLIHLLYRALYWHYHYQQLPRLDAVVCNSEYTREITYLIWGKSVQEEKLKVIYPAIDVDRFERERREKKNQICCVGRLSKTKGVEHAVNAFMQVYSDYNLKMILAGSPSVNLQLRLNWEKELRPFIEGLIRDGAPIELKIKPSYSTVINTLLESKAMVNYSRYEHFGVVPVESQAAGCPPIVSNSGGQKETVEHGKTGFRVDKPEELSKYLRLLLDDEELWKRVSDNGRLMAKNFSFDKIGDQWQTLLTQLKK